jgi:PhnB protein
MGQINLNPYIFFDGQAKEAMEFYKKVFGGELSIQTMAEVPKEARESAINSDPDRVMHASLEGGVVKLMASDSAKASKKAAKIELSLSGTDADKLRDIYDSLSHGGKSSMPLEKQFWGDEFGMVTDKFGVDWMVNIEAKKA